jgi:hypothetical protein
VFCDRLRYKIYLSRGANIVEPPLITVLGVPSNATDLEGLRGFMAFKMSNWENGRQWQESLDNRP